MQFLRLHVVKCIMNDQLSVLLKKNINRQQSRPKHDTGFICQNNETKDFITAIFQSAVAQTF